MGFQTTVGILNDRFDEIQANPEVFVKELLIAINSSRLAYTVGRTTVLPTHHAEEAHVLLSFRNYLIDLAPKLGDSSESNERMLRHIKKAQYVLRCDRRLVEERLVRNFVEEGHSPDEARKKMRAIK